MSFCLKNMAWKSWLQTQAINCESQNKLTSEYMEQILFLVLTIHWAVYQSVYVLQSLSVDFKWEGWDDSQVWATRLL